VSLNLEEISKGLWVNPEQVVSVQRIPEKANGGSLTILRTTNSEHYLNMSAEDLMRLLSASFSTDF
jgi:hypothetical protein